MIQAGTNSTGSACTCAVVGLVLDQFDQPVAVDDDARRHGDGLAGAEFFGADRRLAPDFPLPVSPEIHRAAHEVHAALGQRGLEDLRIGGDEIDRRHRVQGLAGQKAHDLLVMRRNASDPGRRVVPPLLVEEKPLLVEAERRLAPRLALEPGVLRQRLDAGLAFRVGQRGGGIGPETHGLAKPLLRKLLLLARRSQDMRRPVGVGQPQRHRRQAHGVAREPRVQQAVERRRRIGLVRPGHGRGRRRAAFDRGVREAREREGRRRRDGERGAWRGLRFGSWGREPRRFWLPGFRRGRNGASGGFCACGRFLHCFGSACPPRLPQPWPDFHSAPAGKPKKDAFAKRVNARDEKPPRCRGAGVLASTLWPAPSASGLFSGPTICENVSGLSAKAVGQDGDPRVLILIKGPASMRHFCRRITERRSTVRPSSFHHPQTSWAGNAFAPANSPSGRQWNCLINACVPQQGPDDARHLGGKRDDRDIAMRSG